MKNQNKAITDNASLKNIATMTAKHSFIASVILVLITAAFSAQPTISDRGYSKGYPACYTGNRTEVIFFPAFTLIPAKKRYVPVLPANRQLTA